MKEDLPGGSLVIGKVLRPHGTSGLLRIWLYAGSGTSFSGVKGVFLRSNSGDTREFRVAFVKPHKNIFLIKLEEINSREEAEKYREDEILVNKDDLTREADEYFWYELLGLEVYLESGEYVGSISRIIPSSANDIYVARQDKKEVLIPATYEVVKEIDLENGKMVISAMEGLLNLNEI